MTRPKSQPLAAERNVAGFPKRSAVENMLACGDEKRVSAGEATRRRTRKKNAEPVAGYVPGSFSIGWPPGYTPSLTDAELAKAATAKRLQERSTAAAEARLGHAGLDMGLRGSLRTGPVGRM